MSLAVILTALPVEYLAVREHLTNLREEMHPQGTIYERGQFPTGYSSWEVGIAEVGAGNAGAAIEAERAIGHFKPDVLLFVGIAGGIKDVKVGSVEAATKVYGYESGKVGEIFSSRPEVGKSSHAIVQRARAEARKTEWIKRLDSDTSAKPEVFVAPIAAGEKVIASRESALFKFLRATYNNAIAVEMEGYGFLQAAFAYPNIQTLVIRGISDLIEDKNANDPVEGGEEARQKRASQHASAFAFEVLAKLQAKETTQPSVTQLPTSIPLLKLPESDQIMGSDTTEKRVFISYTHDSEEHKERVLELANRLREDGIDANIDQYESSPPEGWQRWMLNQVEDSDYTLVVCTETYNRRFRGQEEAGRGKGGTWEGGVIMQGLYDAQLKNLKFVPVIFADEDGAHIPIPLRGPTSYRLSRPDGYERLYRYLTDQPYIQKPQLGKLQTLPPRERKQSFQDQPGSQVISNTQPLQSNNPVTSVAFVEPENGLKNTPLIHQSISLEDIEKLLSQSKWKEADKQTCKFVLQNNQDKALKADSARRLSLKLLRNIDSLWVKYSKGKFGLRLQQRLWQESLTPKKSLLDRLFSNSKSEPRDKSEAWKEFGCRVGWRDSEKNMLPYTNLNFSLKDPEACFPYTRRWLHGGHYSSEVQQFSALMNKISRLDTEV